MGERRQMNGQERENWYRMLLERANRAGTFSHSAGICITEVGDGWAKGEMEITDRSMNPLGIVHGGVMCTMMDQVTGAAACSRGSTCRTVNCEVRFMAPGVAGKLYAYAEAIRMGGRMAVIRAEVRDDDGVLCAEGTYTLRLKQGFPVEE